MLISIWLVLLYKYCGKYLVHCHMQHHVKSITIIIWNHLNPPNNSPLKDEYIVVKFTNEQYTTIKSCVLLTSEFRYYINATMSLYSIMSTLVILSPNTFEHSGTVLSTRSGQFRCLYVVLWRLALDCSKEKGTHLCIEFTSVYCHCAVRPFRRIPLLISTEPKAST